jgi:hypothetical protein
MHTWHEKRTQAPCSTDNNMRSPFTVRTLPDKPLLFAAHGFDIVDSFHAPWSNPSHTESFNVNTKYGGGYGTGKTVSTKITVSSIRVQMIIEFLLKLQGCEQHFLHWHAQRTGITASCGCSMHQLVT